MSQNLPLTGWRVLVTRPAAQAQPLVTALAAAGAIPLSYPTITVAPPPSWASFDAALAQLTDYRWIIFTSPSAVRCAIEHAPTLVARLSDADAPKVAAVGEETAKTLARARIPVAIVPADQRQEGLVAALSELTPGTKVLFPQAIGGRELLAEQLTAGGAHLDVVPISQTVALPLASPPPAFDAAIFASPSALRALVARWTAEALRDKAVAVMGVTTQTAAHALGVVVDVVPATPSVPALVDALSRYRERLRKG